MLRAIRKLASDWHCVPFKKMPFLNMFQIDTTVQTLSYQGQNTKDGHSILVFGKSILQVPDTGTSQYWSILEHFWCTSIARKCDIYIL